nr:immunoglobulin heavy chain junction region [Mus musculus]MBK4195110.1 immunoglobulin heavy chain junction region [Mus musculus]MBK4195939.1 immunoglobulin heavy chain junction region [Mus musculus]MBK4195942.1 immunoglobulin heavy chain junction region [Mus musculus]MBK4195951.1 immunoglobulin heavy chain junction region [Mus musculus]
CARRGSYDGYNWYYFDYW